MAHKNARRELPAQSLILGDRGRLVLPASVRRRLGLAKGERLILTVDEDGTLHLQPVSRAVEKLCGLYADLAPGRSLADELIAERRDEARREAAQ